MYLFDRHWTITEIGYEYTKSQDTSIFHMELSEYKSSLLSHEKYSFVPFE